MSDCPIPNDDLVRVLEFLLTSEEVELNGYHLMDVGGQLLGARISDPLEKAAPLATIKATDWRVSFRLPKDFPKHYRLSRASRTHIYGIDFEGDPNTCLRDMTFAKMINTP